MKTAETPGDLGGFDIAAAKADYVAAVDHDERLRALHVAGRKVRRDTASRSAARVWAAQERLARARWGVATVHVAVST